MSPPDPTRLELTVTLYGPDDQRLDLKLTATVPPSWWATVGTGDAVTFTVADAVGYLPDRR